MRATRTTEEAIWIAQEGRRKAAKHKGRQLRPQTVDFARHEIVFTTLLASDFTGADMLEWYRLRWRVELVFKQLANRGHLPKHDDESAKEGLYCKLLVAPAVDKLNVHATAISP